MAQNLLRRNMWDTAAKAGLVLGAVSTVYMFISQFLGAEQMGGIFGSILNFLLWGAKFGGCIWLMMFFMKKFAAENETADNSATFRLGVLASFLSALILAAAYFANIGYISADFYQSQMEQVMQMMAPQLDANTTTVMQETLQNLPQMMFWYNLIYCFIFGTLLSFILSRNIPDRNPFANNTSEEF